MAQHTTHAHPAEDPQVDAAVGALEKFSLNISMLFMKMENKSFVENEAEGMKTEKKLSMREGTSRRNAYHD